MDSVRFDRSEFLKPHITADGVMLAEATFAKDGILEYRMPDGKVRKELRRPEANKKALAQFGLSPVTLEHPPTLLTRDNAETYRRGISLNDVRYEVVPGKGGFVRGAIAIFDTEAQDSVNRGDAQEISIGYRCRTIEKPGTWQGQRYDAEQVDLDVNHIAITRVGRAGPDVRLHFDSAESDAIGVMAQRLDSLEGDVRMATITIDGASYEVSESLAGVLAPKLKELERTDSLRERISELEETIDELSEDMEDKEAELMGATARRDAADEVLTKLGYTCRWDGGTSVKYSKQSAEEEDTEAEDDDMEESAEEDDMAEPVKAKGKSKGKTKGNKMDSAAKELVSALIRADSIIPGFSQAFVDEVDSVEDVYRLVVQEAYPHLDVSRKDSSYLEARFDSLIEAAEEYDDEEEDDEDYDEEYEDDDRTDADDDEDYDGDEEDEEEDDEDEEYDEDDDRTDSALDQNELLASLARGRGGYANKTSLNSELSRMDKEITQAYLKPLSMSLG